MNIGIIGTGRIAKRFVPECFAVPGADITAVYNPHDGSASRFVDEMYGEVRDTPTLSRRSSDTESITESDQTSTFEIPAVVQDADKLWELVDAVYIASPHEKHIEHATDAFKHGKHVLCEKPMALYKDEANTVFALAAEKKLVLMEGLKTAYAPGYKKLIETARSGIIGEIRYIDACFTKLENPQNRELTDLVYGGSFLELGSYVLLPVFDLLGMITHDISFDRIRDKQCREIDLFTRAIFRKGDALATVTCGLGVKSEGRLVIGGTKGYIVVPAPWWKTARFEIHFENPSDVRVYEETFEGDGLRYEIREFINRVKNNRTSPSSHEIQRNIWMAEVMERFYRQR